MQVITGAWGTGQRLRCVGADSCAVRPGYDGALAQDDAVHSYNTTQPSTRLLLFETHEGSSTVDMLQRNTVNAKATVTQHHVV